MIQFQRKTNLISNKSKLWKRLKRLKRKLNSTPSRCSQKLIFARTWSIKSISRHTYGHIIVNALHIVRKNGEKERGHVPSAPLMLAWHRSAICMAGQQLSHRVFQTVFENERSYPLWPSLLSKISGIIKRRSGSGGKRNFKD